MADLPEGCDVLKALLSMLVGFVLGPATLYLGMTSGLPSGLVMVLFVLALGGPIAVGRWLDHTDWLRLLPRERRVRFTVLLPAIVVATGLVAGSLDHLATRDRAFVITEMQVRMQVEPGGGAVIEEELTVEFRRSRRGIIRELPPEIPDAWSVALPRRDVADSYDEDGNPRSIVELAEQDRAARPAHVRDYEVLSATLNSGSVPVSESRRRDGGLELRIGDANRQLERGTYRYLLRYRAPSWTFVTGPSAEQAETRINVPGYSWASRIDEVDVTVSLPGEVDAARCVQGSLGATRPCDGEVQISGTEVQAVLGPFPDHTGATLSLHHPVAAFDQPPPEANVPALDDGGWRTTLPRPVTGLLLAALLVLPTVGLVLVDVRASTGSWRPSPAPARPSALPMPPGDLDPVEVAGLRQRRVASDLLLAELIRAEQRGLIQVHLDGEEARITTKGWSEVQQDPVLAGLLPLTLGSYDRETAARIHQAGRQLTARARDVLASRGLLRGTRRIPALVRAVVAAVVVAGGLWLTNAVIEVTRLSALAGYGVLLVFMLAVFAAAALWWGRRPSVTPEGRELLAQAEAFDHFIATVEEEQLQWAAEQPEIDTRHPALALLPYAIALGRSDVWWQRFGGTLRTQAPDDWAMSVAQPGLLRDLTRITTQLPSSGTADPGMFTGPSSLDGPGGGGGGGGSGGGGGGGRSW